MKALILAAGRGSRMLPLTEKIPKPLMRVHDKPILEWIISSLPDDVDELHIVIGHFGDQIKDHLGDSFEGKKIFYHTQEKAEGTWPAMKLTEKIFKKGEKFLLTYADDMYDQESIKKAAEFENSLLVYPVEDPSRYGVVELHENHTVKSIEEKPKVPKSNLVGVGVYVLNSSIFDHVYPEGIEGEQYFVNVYREYIKNNLVNAVYVKHWVSIATPKDLEDAHKSELFML
jgi:bifunctional UDP-N-acetylglucosamine pyrophosphorylase/glucosamine-1-phosphate N-acetyltransferase